MLRYIAQQSIQGFVMCLIQYANTSCQFGFIVAYNRCYLSCRRKAELRLKLFVLCCKGDVFINVSCTKLTVP